ncbi:MAG: T9SS type A sorting domain-containing protein [Bacteroidetes bacterium]|nr:T9SS type A sorting domain-containing protein [Bacteroidota bacterium]
MKVWLRFLLIGISLFQIGNAYAQLQVTFSADTTQIWEKNVGQSCAAMFTSLVETRNDTVFVTEVDTALFHATCWCYYTLRTDIVGLLPGEYIASVSRKNNKHELPEFIGTIPFTVTYGSVQNLSVKGTQSRCYSSPQSVHYGALPSSPYLLSNYPNPFNPVTLISYTVPVSGNLKIEVYDVQGIKVATVVDRFVSAGDYEVPFDAFGLSSGIYLLRMTNSETSLVNKITFLK